MNIARQSWETAVRARSGRLSGLSVLRGESVLYGVFVWAHRALDGPKRRFPARAVREPERLERGQPLAVPGRHRALHRGAAGRRRRRARLGGGPARGAPLSRAAASLSCAALSRVRKHVAPPLRVTRPSDSGSGVRARCKTAFRSAVRRTWRGRAGRRRMRKARRTRRSGAATGRKAKARRASRRSGPPRLRRYHGSVRARPGAVTRP
jgi:hypothetical protein